MLAAEGFARLHDIATKVCSYVDLPPALPRTARKELYKHACDIVFKETMTSQARAISTTDDTVRDGGFTRGTDKQVHELDDRLSFQRMQLQGMAKDVGPMHNMLVRKLQTTIEDSEKKLALLRGANKLGRRINCRKGGGISPNFRERPFRCLRHLKQLRI